MARTEQLRSALWASHRRLLDATERLTHDQLVGDSYCTDWSKAQVLSHIGSGAEIFGLFLEAGLAGSEPPQPDAFKAIWDRWNAMTPDEQATASRDANLAFLQRLDSAGADQLDSMRLTMFGNSTDAARLLGMRLAEHAVHTWDVLVMDDSAAVIASDAAEQILEGLHAVVERTGKPGEHQLEADVITTDPSRRLRLSVSDGVRLLPADGAIPGDGGPAAAEIRMPAEALIRLVYGRLDPEHTASTVSTSGVELETLRSIFPGF